MKPQTPDAGGIANRYFSRHQVPTAALSNPVRPKGKSRLRLGAASANQNAELALGNISAVRRHSPAGSPAGRAEESSVKPGRSQVRRAIKRWCFTHAHTAWKTLVISCAAI
jgi:hypothetical protein